MIADIPTSSDDADSETTQVDVADIKLAKERARRQRPVLTVIEGVQPGKPFLLSSHAMHLGRHPQRKIRLLGHGISRKHARIEKESSGNLVLSDTGSSNGTFVNGVRIRRHVLRDGDTVQIGPSTLLRFSYEDRAETAIRVQQYEQSVRDDLTGVFNRRYFIDALNHELAYSSRHSFPFGLILMDVDHFKSVNDRAGHQAGDEVLKQLSRLIGETVREEDVFARYGGEEFGVVLRGQDGLRTHQSAERIRLRVESARLSYGEHAFTITTSQGVAAFDPKAPEDIDTLIRRADENLYAAKRQGRNRSIG
jgi:two-component system, cell cycle response regulator